MKVNYCYLLIVGFLLFSCNEVKHSELLTIPVDSSQNVPLALSAITEDLIAIELELTNESLINPDRISRILLSENYVIVAKLNQVLVFGKDGKFVRSIGTRGQGVGGFNFIVSVAIDEKNKRLFIGSTNPQKIISYDLSGTFLNEVVNPIQYNPLPHDMHYIDGKLLLVAQHIGFCRNKNKRFLHSMLYHLDDNFQVIDSHSIRKTYFAGGSMASIHPCTKNIVKGAEATFFYLSEIYDRWAPTEITLRDTLYRLENNQLIPELRLKFRNDGIDRGGNKFIELHNIFRSSRYVFSTYRNNLTNNTYQFVFDTKTGIGNNMQDGFIDDINNIEERIIIRPLTTNSEMFYFWHTHMDPDCFEEPNPTLYIGRLRR